MQLFTILGLCKRITRNRGADGENDDGTVALPFVYALLSSKSTDQYASVLQAVKSVIENEFLIQCDIPNRFMCDFELSIINACTEIYPDVDVSCCQFHLGQSVYRKVQNEGLQEAYNDPDNRTVKQNVHMMLALAYVPVDDVANSFRSIKNQAPRSLQTVLTYFDETYVNGRRAVGRRAAVEPRYRPAIWNQYEAALAGDHKTNNISEGWHNRFRLIVGKHHPDLYAALSEIQKEQGDTDIALAELAMGKAVKAAPKRKWLTLKNRIKHIVSEYEDYRARNQVLDYLRTLGYNITL